MRLTRLHLVGARVIESDAGQTAEVTYAVGGATHRVVLDLDAVEGTWRGTIDRRERLHCEIPPDVALALTYTVELPEGSPRVSVTCALSLDGITAEARVTTPARFGVAHSLTAARASALNRLADAVAEEVELCDTGYRALVDGETRWTAADESIFVPATLVAGSTDAHGRRGSYVTLHATSTGRMKASNGRARETGYLAAPALVRAGPPSPLGGYGAAARVIGQVARGYMVKPNGRASQQTTTGSATKPALDTSATAAMSAELQALGLTLLRLQNVLTALDGVALTDA